MREGRERWATHQSFEEAKTYRPAASAPPLPRVVSGNSLGIGRLRSFRASKPSFLIDVLLLLIPILGIFWRLEGLEHLRRRPLTWQHVDVSKVPTIFPQLRTWVEKQRGQAECKGETWAGLPFSALEAYAQRHFTQHSRLSDELLTLEQLLRNDQMNSHGLRASYTLDGSWRIFSDHSRLPFLCLPHFISRTHPWETSLWLSWALSTIIVLLLRRSDRLLLTKAERIYKQLLRTLRASRVVNPLDAVPELRLLAEKQYQRLYRKINLLRLEDGRAVIIPRGSQHLWSLI